MASAQSFGEIQTAGEVLRLHRGGVSSKVITGCRSGLDYLSESISWSLGG